MSGFHWVEEDGGFRCHVSERVTLVVTPEHYARGFVLRPKRGTKWRAQATSWDEATRTASRYGRDESCNLQDSADEAKRLAEDIYNRA